MSCNTKKNKNDTPNTSTAERRDAPKFKYSVAETSVRWNQTNEYRCTL